MFLKTEFKRAILNRKIIIAILLGLIFQSISVFARIKNDLFASSTVYPNPEDLIHLIGNATNRFQLWYFSTDLYTIIMPLICCIPFVGSYLEDTNGGFINFITIRTSFKKYVFSKVIVVFSSGFMTIFISSSLFYLFISLIKPNNLEYCSLNTYGFLSDLFNVNPNLYVIYYILICSIMGGTFALIGLAVSTKINNPLIPIIAPMLYWYAGTFLFDTLKLVSFEPASINAYFVRPNVTGYSIFLQLFLYSTISIITFTLISKRGRV